MPNKTWLLVVGLITAAALFQLFFRYQYIHTTGTRIVRIDRLTGNSCALPCKASSAIPEDTPTPVDESLLDSRAIEAVKARAAGGNYPEEGYEWEITGRYSPGGSIELDCVEGGTGTNPFDPNFGCPSPDASAYSLYRDPGGLYTLREVCYCDKKGAGWFWEYHTDTKEVFMINGNRTLEKRYGI